MILDKYLSFDQKIYISLVVAAIWIYFRTQSCYALLPRHSLLSVMLVVFWLYANYYEPLVVPIGLLVLYLYSFLETDFELK